MQKENQRITLTKRLLKEGLFRLLKTKELNKINISELCKEAGINRATFYKHYNSPQDVLKDVENDMINDLKNLSDNPATIPAAIDYLESMCVYLKERSDLVKLLIQYNLDTDLEKTFHKLNRASLELCGNITPDEKLDADSVKLISTFLCSGCYILLLQWLVDDIQKTPREIAELIFQLISKNEIFNVSLLLQ